MALNHSINPSHPSLVYIGTVPFFFFFLISFLFRLACSIAHFPRPLYSALRISTTSSIPSEAHPHTQTHRHTTKKNRQGCGQVAFHSYRRGGSSGFRFPVFLNFGNKTSQDWH